MAYPVSDGNGNPVVLLQDLKLIMQDRGLADSSGNVLEIKTAFINPATATTTTIVAAVATKRIRVLNAEISQNGTGNTVNFLSAAAEISANFKGAANSLFTLRRTNGGFLFETVAGEALRVTTDAAQEVGIMIQYVEYS